MVITNSESSVSDPAEIARMQASQPAAGPAWPGPDGAADEDGQEDLLP